MAGLDAFGIALERSDMQPTPTFTAIGNVTNVSGPEHERETYDVTAHDSPNRYREKIGGLIDAGDVTLTVNYDPAEHDILIGDLEDTVARDYKLKFPAAASTWDFKAWQTGFSQEAPVDGKLSAEITFAVTGKPTIT